MSMKPLLGKDRGALVKHEFCHLTGSHLWCRPWLATEDRPHQDAVKRAQGQGQPTTTYLSTLAVCEMDAGAMM